MTRPLGTAKTGGRKAGTPNKRTQEISDKLNALKCDPIKGMIQIANQAKQEGNLALAGQMYRELAQYLYPKRKAMEVSTDQGVKPPVIEYIIPERQAKQSAER